MPQRDLVVALTGASGAPYAVRLLEMLVRSGRRIHVTASPAAVQVFQTELGVSLDVHHLSQLLPPELESAAEQLIAYHAYMNFLAPIASGSQLTGGMVICPCSMGTVSAIAHGSSQNLIQRAADVHLKERRPLILVPRETPLSLVQLRNLAACVEAGAIVLPAMPAFYTKPATLQDMVDFIVGRVCDQLGVEHHLFPRWGEQQMEDT